MCLILPTFPGLDMYRTLQPPNNLSKIADVHLDGIDHDLSDA